MTEVLTVFGSRGVSSGHVVQALKRAVQKYLSADAPVGEHLADQLLLPLALLAGGSFRTVALSSHTETNASVVDLFLGSGTVELGDDTTRDSTGGARTVCVRGRLGGA